MAINGIEYHIHILIGTKPTVALYNDNPHDYPFWAEFHPVPISHGTSDQQLLKQKYDSFSSDDFEKLDRFIKQTDTLHPGTYKIDVDSSNWKEYPNVEVGNISKMKGPEGK